MKKVRITQAQANAIEERIHLFEEGKDEVLKRQIHHQNNNSCSRYKSGTDSEGLNGMDIALLARALYRGYESATEKQQKWWDKHKRDVWEIRPDDVLTHKVFGGDYVVWCIEGDLVRFTRDKEHETIQSIEENFEVRYFREDRKDA